MLFEKVMRNKSKFKDNKIVQSLIIFCAVIVVIISLIGDKGLVQYMALKDQEEKLEMEIQQLKEKRQEWIKKIQSIKSNQTYIENIAREQLGMIRKDEKLIKLRFKDDL